MIVRGKVAFAFAVAIAQFQELARAVDAQSFDHIARPAVAIGLSGQAPFGREHATAAHRGNVALEVNLVAEQAESVLDLPLDMGSGAGCRLRVDRLSSPGREHKEKADHKERAHGISRDRPMRRDMISMADAAEMLTSLSSHLWVIIFAIGISWATVRLRYYQIANTLKWLALVLWTSAPFERCSGRP